MTRSRKSSRVSAFTLIEVLVVVAIIALLVSILLPSLAAARDQARMTSCAAQLKMVGTAFMTWASEHDGRLPGVEGMSNQNDHSTLDWIGAYRVDLKSQPKHPLQQPRQGALWRYMGRDAKAYICPSDAEYRQIGSEQYMTTYSYAFHGLLSGAALEWLAGAHHLKDPYYDDDRHNGQAVNTKGDVNPIVPFDGVPMVIEENYEDGISTDNPSFLFDGNWSANDMVTERHLNKGGKGKANVAYHDGHVGNIQLPGGDRYDQASGNVYFTANDLCVRTSRGKWFDGGTDHPTLGDSNADAAKTWTSSKCGYGTQIQMTSDRNH